MKSDLRTQKNYWAKITNLTKKYFFLFELKDRKYNLNKPKKETQKYGDLSQILKYWPLQTQFTFF